MSEAYREFEAAIDRLVSMGQVSFPESVSEAEEEEKRVAEQREERQADRRREDRSRHNTDGSKTYADAHIGSRNEQWKAKEREEKKAKEQEKQNEKEDEVLPDSDSETESEPEIMEPDRQQGRQTQTHRTGQNGSTKTPSHTSTSHTAHSADTVSTPSAEGPPVCRYWLIGSCYRGNACPFSHVVSGPAQGPPARAIVLGRHLRLCS